MIMQYNDLWITGIVLVVMSSRVACSYHISLSQVSLWGGYIGVPVRDRVMIGSPVPCVIAVGCWGEVEMLGAVLI